MSKIKVVQNWVFVLVKWKFFENFHKNCNIMKFEAKIEVYWAKNATKATFFCVFFIKNMTKISKLYFAKVEGLLKTPGLHDV